MPESKKILFGHNKPQKRTGLNDETLKDKGFNLLRLRKKFLPHIVISLLSLVSLVLYVNTFPPTSTFDIFSFQLSPLIPFFFLLFLSFGGIFVFLFGNIRRGVLLSVFIVSFLLLQYLHTNNLMFDVILILILILIEFLFWRKS